MRQEYYLWNGYRLIQDDRFFKLGQDSVLLSAFAQPPARARVIDLGCGNGALGFLLCAESKTIDVTGVEIQPEVARLAQENVQINQLDNRVHIVCGDVCEYKKLFCAGEFDYVICNPPYFETESGYHAQGKNRKIARQEIDGTMEDFVQAAGYLLKFGGRAAFVFRPERLTDSIALFQKYGMQPKRMRFVHQTAQKTPSVVLTEVRRGSASGVQILPPLLICGEDGKKTEEYNRIYHIT